MGVSSPCSSTTARPAGLIGAKGSSFSSPPRTTGSHSSSRSTSSRAIRVLAWPRSPRKTMSWPATIAFSTAGMTLSPKPTMPGRIPWPAASRSRRLARISSLTVRLVQPDARNSLSVAGSVAGLTGRVTVGERTTGLVGPSNALGFVAVRRGTGLLGGVRAGLFAGRGHGLDRDPTEPDLAVTDHHGAASQRYVGEQVDAGDAPRT